MTKVIGQGKKRFDHQSKRGGAAAAQPHLVVYVAAVASGREKWPPTCIDGRKKWQRLTGLKLLCWCGAAHGLRRRQHKLHADRCISSTRSLVALHQIAPRNFPSCCNRTKGGMPNLHRLNGRDEFELEFSGLSRAELSRFRAKPSWGTSIFELKPSWQYQQYERQKIANFYSYLRTTIKFPNFRPVSWL